MPALVSIDLGGGDYGWYVVTDAGWAEIMAWEEDETAPSPEVADAFFCHVSRVVHDKAYVIAEGACQDGVPADHSTVKIAHLLYLRAV